ncbi:putative DUF4191 family protein [Brevibacillus sp. IT-7CA2]|uniref:hypothetical protein n=1 Tax=Brevibacillus sp. IT-7CA2 TaxID=3026436 RepID=UPI0039E0DE33
MNMHKLRMWQKKSLFLGWGMIVVVIILVLLHVMGILEDYVIYIASVLYVLTLYVIFWGLWKRKNIQRKWRNDSKRMGLKRIMVIPIQQEDKSEKHFELHIMHHPKEKITKVQLLREFIRDIETLYEYASQQRFDLVFIGTTHEIFRKAARKTVTKLGLEWQETDELHDPSAPQMSVRDWKNAIKKLYGRQLDVAHPIKEEWKTFIVRYKGGIQVC